MNCPECRKHLPEIATACRCGWVKSGNAVQPLGYQQCEWLAGSERCKYPGTISSNTHEGGPYFCRLHFGCDDGHWGAQIVEASRDYKHPTPEELMAEHNERAKANLKAKGLAKRDDESPQAWRKRMIGYLKANMGGVAKKAA